MMLGQGIKSFLILGLWAGSLCQQSAAKSAFDPEHSTLVTPAISSTWSPLQSLSTSAPDDAELSTSSLSIPVSPPVTSSSIDGKGTSSQIPEGTGQYNPHPVIPSTSASIHVGSGTSLAILSASTSTSSEPTKKTGKSSSIPITSSPASSSSISVIKLQRGSSTVTSSSIIPGVTPNEKSSSPTAPLASAPTGSQKAQSTSSLYIPSSTTSSNTPGVTSNKASASPAVTRSASSTVIPPTQSHELESIGTFSTDVVALYPVIQDWIKSPDPPHATPLIQAIKDSNPSDNKGGSCSNPKSATDLIECASTQLTKIKSNVEDTLKDHTTDNTLDNKVKAVSGIFFKDIKPPVAALGELTLPPGSPGGPPDNNDPEDPDNESSTATSTTSTSSTPTPSSRKYCSPGCSACAPDNIDSPAPSGNSRSKRSLPQDGGPGGSNAADWFRDKVVHATKLPHVKFPGQPTTAMMMPLLERSEDYAVVNLAGCTVLIVMSKNALYMAHFWEADSFVEKFLYRDDYGNVLKDMYGNDLVGTEYNPERFDSEVLGAMSSGAVMVNENDWRQGGLDPSPFTGGDAETEAIIITPLNSAGDDIMYPLQVSKIIGHLTSLVHNVPEPVIQSYDITPRDPLVGPGSAHADDISWPYGKVVVEYNPADDILVHNEPQNYCEVVAGINIYLGGHGMAPIKRKRWSSLPTQLGLQRRDAACPLPSGPSASAGAGASDRAGAALGGAPGGGAPTTLLTSPSRAASGSMTSPLRSSTNGDNPLCVPTSGPDTDKSKCACSESGSSRILPTLSSSDSDMCGYKILPAPASSTRSASSSSTPIITSHNSSPPPTPAPTPGQFCLNKADPHNSEGNVCECSSTSSDITFATTLPLPSSGGCELITSYPVTSTETGWPFTSTNAGGTVLAYKTSTLSYFSYSTTKYTYTQGAGESTVLSAPSPTGYPFTSTLMDSTVMAFATSTKEYVNAGGATQTYDRGAGSSTVVAAPTPKSGCAYWNRYTVSNLFLIYGIKDWGVGVDELEKGLEECGELTAWASSSSNEWGLAAKFKLPGSAELECVEKAVEKAGGPAAGDAPCRNMGTAEDLSSKGSVESFLREFREQGGEAPWMIDD